MGACIAGALASLVVSAASGAVLPGSSPTPDLHVAGRFLRDPKGHLVLLHGWYQPAQSYFNGGGGNYPDPTDYTSPSNVAPALRFLDGEADIYSHHSPLYGADHGWDCNFVRFNGTNNNNSFAPGWDSSGYLTDRSQFRGWLTNFVIPYINHCRQDGLYVILMGTASQSYPGGDVTKNMTQAYQQSLTRFWQIVSATPGIKNAGNVQFELCNEPINIETHFGAGDWGSGDDAHWAALTQFMQPIVNVIRREGAKNVVWVPGLGWQSQYQGYAGHPVHGGNIGYAAHLYPSYGGVFNNTGAVDKFWDSNYKPCADLYPMIITEMFWYPNDGKGYDNMFNGTTGDSNSGFGTAVHNCIDAEANVSYLIGGGAPLLDLSKGLRPSGGYAPVASSEGAQAAFDWFPAYVTHR